MGTSVSPCTLAPTPWLDGKHTIFGRVCGGMGRGLQSSTFQLNVSTFCDTWGAHGGTQGQVRGVFRACVGGVWALGCV